MEKERLRGPRESPPHIRQKTKDLSHIPFELHFSGRHEGLTRLKYWVIDNGALTLTLEESARIACLEPHYFSAMFRQRVGQSFKEWRCRYRIAWAIQEMANDRHSLYEILQRAGYRNRRAFERAVKRFTGSTPARLRQRS